jgi:hypothetical protein
MKADQAYPPVVGVSVIRARDRVGNQAAEKAVMAELQGKAPDPQGRT